MKIEVAPDGSIRLSLEHASLAARAQSALQQSIEIVRRRIDAVGVAEPTVQALGSSRILVQLPGVQDPASIRTLLGSTAKLTFHRVESSHARGSGTVPAGSIRVPASDEAIDYVLQRRPLLQGERLVQANSGIDSLDGGPVVSFRFDDAGKRQFAQITRENVGRQLAIVLDGKVISAPVIQEPIIGGSGQIRGTSQSPRPARWPRCCAPARSPVPLQIIEERMVGPDLGSDAIRMGALTGAAGLLLVLVFMTVLYRAMGDLANLALLVNVALTLGGADAARRDADAARHCRHRARHRARGRCQRADQRAHPRGNTQRQDGSGRSHERIPARLCDGHRLQRHCAHRHGAAVLVRLRTRARLRDHDGARHRHLDVHRRYGRQDDHGRCGPMAPTPEDFVIGSLLPARWADVTPNFQFMRARFIGLGASLVLSIASVFLFMNPGLNYGVDFTGGTISKRRRRPAAICAIFAPASNGARPRRGQPAGSRSDGSTVLVRRTAARRGCNRADAARRAGARRRSWTSSPSARFDRVEVIGPKVSGELADAGILAVLFASVAMFIYIWVRFEWHFAVGAIATLVLDTTKMLGFFALTGLEFNLTAIAALLTLIGYSVNDKVVVYDRMRENLRLYRARRCASHRPQHQRDAGTLLVHLGNRVPGHAADGDLGRQRRGRASPCRWCSASSSRPAPRSSSRRRSCYSSATGESAAEPMRRIRSCGHSRSPHEPSRLRKRGERFYER